MSEPLNEASLLFSAWSQVWSPLVDDEVRAAAWDALGFPEAYSDCKQEYWNLFQVGAPLPKVPLLLHFALSLDGGTVREDWLRVQSHLGLTWNAEQLAPDHLGAACEVHAFAIEQAETVLVKELPARYFLPWCDVAEQKLTEEKSRLVFLPQMFRTDLGSIEIVKT